MKKPHRCHNAHETNDFWNIILQYIGRFDFGFVRFCLAQP